MNRLRVLLTCSMLFLLASFASAQDTLTITSSTTGLEQKIAYEDIITVQPQGQDDRALIVYGSNYGTVVTLEVYDDVIDYQRCRLFDFTNRVSGRRTAVSYSSIDTVLSQGSQGYAQLNVSIDRFGYAALFTTKEKFDQVFPQWAECDNLVQRPVYDVVNIGYGVPIGTRVVDGKLQLRSIVGVNGTTVTERAGVVEIDGGGSGGGGGSSPTNLSRIQGATSVVIESSTGNSTTISPASSSVAGVMTASDKSKLDGIEAGATADQTAAEIEAILDAYYTNTDWRTQGGGSESNLTYFARATDGLLDNDNGANAIIPAVGTNAGLMLPADKTKLDGIESGATADQTPAEIETSYNSSVSVVSQADAEAGTSSTVYRWTPERVAQAINSLSPSGGPSGGDFSLSSGAVTVEGEYIGSSAPTITNPSAGEYTITVPAGTRLISMRVFGNNTTLNGSNEFVFRVDHTADAVNRMYTVQQLNASTGGRSDVFSIGTNETQNITSNVTQITFPGMNGYGSSGFFIVIV